MARLRRNFLSGTITDNPLTAGATTINSAGFASMPAVASPDTLAIVLDPLGTAGTPEIAYVTAHTASATSATVSRGQEQAYGGIAGRQHASGIAWVHAETAYDQHIRANPPTCRVYSDTAQAVPDNGSATMTFNQTRFDPWNMHDPVTNNSRVVFPIAGVYAVGFTCQLVVASDYQRVLAGITAWSSGGVSQGDIVYSPTRAATLSGYGEAPLLSVNTQWKFAAGEWMTAYVFQDNAAGASRNVSNAAPQSPEIWATYLGEG